MKINEISVITNVSKRSLRYYEKMGLIKPKRKKNGYRIYSIEDIKIIERIKLFVSAGVPLRNIKYIVSCTLHTDKVLMCKELEKIFFDEMEKLEVKISQLKQSKRYLKQIIDNREIVED